MNKKKVFIEVFTEFGEKFLGVWRRIELSVVAAC
jgi:hypothetical protein